LNIFLSFEVLLVLLDYSDLSIKVSWLQREELMEVVLVVSEEGSKQFDHKVDNDVFSSRVRN